MTRMHIRRSARYQGKPWRHAEIRPNSRGVISECKQNPTTSRFRAGEMLLNAVGDGPLSTQCIVFMYIFFSQYSRTLRQEMMTLDFLRDYIHRRESEGIILPFVLR